MTTYETGGDLWELIDRLRAELAARPPVLTVERLAEAIHATYPDLRSFNQCDHVAVYDGRTECQYDAAAILAALGPDGAARPDPAVAAQVALLWGRLHRLHDVSPPHFPGDDPCVYTDALNATGATTNIFIGRVKADAVAAFLADPALRSRLVAHFVRMNLNQTALTSGRFGIGEPGRLADALLAVLAGHPGAVE